MKTNVLIFAFAAITLFLACTEEPEERIEDTWEYQLENRGVFTAEINGEKWVAKKIQASYDVPYDVLNLLIVAGTGSDTVITINIDEPEEKTYVRDTLNPEESAHPGIMDLSFNSNADVADVKIQNWEAGELTILSITEDSVEAHFNFATKSSEIKNGHFKLYLGEDF